MKNTHFEMFRFSRREGLCVYIESGSCPDVVEALISALNTEQMLPGGS